MAGQWETGKTRLWQTLCASCVRLRLCHMQAGASGSYIDITGRFIYDRVFLKLLTYFLFFSIKFALLNISNIRTIYYTLLFFFIYGSKIQ